MNIFRKFISEYSHVVKAADRQTAAVFKKFGAFTRRTAKGSIRQAKGPAKPGNPPHSHKGLLKKFIYFVWDAARRSVIIGPAKLNGTIGPAPEALEKGGQSRAVVGRRGHKHIERIQIEARPYIGPAAKKEEKQLPALWANSVQK